MGVESLSVEDRLTKVEGDVATMKTNILQLQSDNLRIMPALDDINLKLASIDDFVTGTTKIFGFAKKHWMKALSFGCGLMTAAGIGNPAVWNFIRHFFGL